MTDWWNEDLLRMATRVPLRLQLALGPDDLASPTLPITFLETVQVLNMSVDFRMGTTPDSGEISMTEAV